MKKVTIAIVDDHRLIREMWAKMFSGTTEYEVTGESGVLQEAIEMIKLKRPDIVLLDINLAQESGLDAVPLIRKFSPGSKIIAVSMHNRTAFVKKMMRLGAKAYVTKNSSHKEMFKAIEEVMNGRTYVCSEIKDIFAEQALQSEMNEPAIKDLSMREIEVIKLIKQGMSSKEISPTLKISTRTVEVHRHNILKKLKLKNSASLINFINTSDLII
jgi:two-component system, NarL family, invasion response regulator UvrY